FICAFSLAETRQGFFTLAVRSVVATDGQRWISSCWPRTCLDFPGEDSEDSTGKAGRAPLPEGDLKKRSAERAAEETGRGSDRNRRDPRRTRRTSLCSLIHRTSFHSILRNAVSPGVASVAGSVSRPASRDGFISSTPRLLS